MPDTLPLRYVVLRHDGIAEPHFDLMFETTPEAPLATWRSDVWPLTELYTPLVYLPEHRRLYLDYEGPVSNNRGKVRRVDSGTHTVHHDHPILLVVQLENGDVLRLHRGGLPGVERLPAE